VSDLDQREQNHVRAAMNFVRILVGGLRPVAKALQADHKSIVKIANGSRSVSASMALRVARLLDVPMEDLLTGRYRPGACPKCGHKPGYMPVCVSDFTDESTIVEDAPRFAGDALKLVR